MNKLKLFLNNFLIYGVGGIIGKIVPLIMVPIITRIMPSTDYFGISDMSNTILSFCSALAIMGMYDAMYRMFFEKEEEQFKKEICSTAFLFTIATSVIICLIMIALKDYLAKWFLGDKELAYLIYIVAIATLVGATNSIVAAPTRMQNKRIIYLIMNTISPVVSYGISIPLLLTGHYIIALPLAGMITAILSEIIFFILNRKWFSFKLFKIKYLKPLILIALPLLPNFVIYWIFDSCDKLMITNMLGVGAEGVYSVGAKFGHVSQLIYTAFAGGWQFFAFSIMKEENQVKTNSRIFEYLGIISFCCSMFVFALSEPVFKLLFEKDYHDAFIIAPYLFLAPLLLMLFQVADNQLLVIKKTWPNLLILSLGAGLNILLNYFLIPVLGIEGAAIATLSGYVLSLIICVIVLYFMKLIKLDLRFYISVILMLGYLCIWRLLTINIIWLNVLMAISVSAIMILLYLKDIKTLLRGLKKKKVNVEEDLSVSVEKEKIAEDTNSDNDNFESEPDINKEIDSEP